jgi:hypothetical protein
MARLRAVVASLVLAGSFAFVGPSSAAAYTGDGFITTGWSCPPDSQISMVFSVTGTGSGANVGLEIWYRDIYGSPWSSYILGRTIYPGITTIGMPRPSRTVTKVGYSTYHAVLNWVAKDCS